MTMDSIEFFSWFCYRIIVPLVLIVATFLRISFVSLIWLLFFLAVPCLPKFSRRNWAEHGSLRVYILLLLVVSCLVCCGHVVYFSLEFSNKMLVEGATLCNSTNLTLMNIGFQTVDPTVVPDVLDRLRLIMPDFIVFFTAAMTTLFCYKTGRPVGSKYKRIKTKIDWLWRTLEPFSTSVFLFLAGAAAPSAMSAIYFLTFICTGTLWALGVKFTKIAYLKILLLVYSGLHIICLYIYQFKDTYTYFPPSGFAMRLLGFVQYYDRECEVLSNGTIIRNPLHLKFTPDLMVTNYMFPFALIGLYFCLGLSARYLVKICRTTPICQATEEEQLLLSDGRGNEYNTINVDGVVEDAQALRASIRSRRSSIASSYQQEDEEPIFSQIIGFVTKLFLDQVYLVTLAVLMLWCITYVSWIEFVLLILACLLCICPKAKEASYSVAYPLVFYCTILVFIQYIYGLNLTNKELREMKDVGLKRDESGIRGKAVYFKTLYLCVLWIHLRAYLIHSSAQAAGSSTQDSNIRHNRYTLQIYKLYRWVRSLILVYWPVICYAALMIASLHSKGINIMRIVYLMFFTAFMFFYVVARRPLELRQIWLWYMLITYSMICVILQYTYQFENIRNLWTNNMLTIADIGLSYSVTASDLFIKLIVPMLVLLTVTIQLRVFRTEVQSEEERQAQDQQQQQQLSNLEEPTPSPSPTSEDPHENVAGPSSKHKDIELEKKRNRLKSTTYMTNIAQNLADTMKEFWSDSKSFAERAFHISLAILEMHSPKFVSLTVFFVCIWRVSVINTLLLLVTVITLPWPLVQYKLTIPLFCWVTWEIFSQLIYQLNMVKNHLDESVKTYVTLPNCSENTEPFTCSFSNRTNFQWLGYTDMSKHLDNSPWYLVWGYVIVIIMLVIQRLLVHYMKGRRSPYVYILRESIFPDFIFPNISRESAEKNITFQLMYLCNNFFVLFGGEVVKIAHVIVAASRYDLYGLIYIVLLGVWSSLSSRNKSKGCIPYIVLVEVLIILQYFLLLGMPPSICFKYPWCALQSKKLSLLVWLYLPTTPRTANPYFIFADFLLLICLTRLWHVFTLQKLDPTLAGAIDSSPGPDYADPKNKSLLNNIKLFLFTYMWWITAAVLFINAVTTISIFSAGFLLATFSLLWYGSIQLTKDKAVLIHRWNFILMYAYVVIFLKIVLQIPACMQFSNFRPSESSVDKIFCVLVDVFKLICLQEKFQDNNGENMELGNRCGKNSKSTGLSLDAITFMFVLIQIKIFYSPYFEHARKYLTILVETSAQGAMIMKQRMTFRTKLNRIEEEKTLHNIKKHVAKLKAEHDSRQDFDFGTKELRQEAEEFWEERDRQHREHEKRKALMYQTQEELNVDLDAVGSLASEPNGVLKEEPEVEEKVQQPGEEVEEKVQPGEEGGAPDELDELLAGMMHASDADKAETPTWEPAELPAEKPADEVIVEFIEFSHSSIVDFLEFTIAWLDEKSGDYRYTSAAIFKERYTALTDNSVSILQSTITEIEVLEDVPPSSLPTEPLLARLCVAIYYFCLARTELLCFLFMILNHLLNASILSMFYPLIAFLWGMIAFPRPSGIFWYIVIVYCKATIVLKYIVQFQSIGWNDDRNNRDPMWAPNLLGLNKTDDLILSTVWDLLILMSVFFHKSCLETAGIWSLWYNEVEDLVDEEIDDLINRAVKEGEEEETMETALQGPSMQIIEEEDPDEELRSIRSDAEMQGDSDDGTITQAYEFPVLAKVNFILFFKLLIDGSKKDNPLDLYMPMLLSSLFALIVTVLGWSAFGKVEGQDMIDVGELLSTNYIPSVFLIILLIQFMMMIIDRVLYLKRSMLAKYIYQVFVVAVVHGYLFIFQPWFTHESFKSSAALVTWYIFFCCYFTFSAFQVQSGYPNSKKDSIILKSYGYVTYVIYLGYLAVPFLWELEVLLNWVCTETTLTLDYWIKYSDIKVYLFKLKCWQVTYESAYYFGMKQPAYMKYGIGGLLVFILILIIWFPLLFMSVVTTNSVPNLPTAFSCSLSISGLSPLVKLNVANMPKPVSENELDRLKGLIESANKTGNNTEYITKYRASDVVRLDLHSESISMWEISPAAERSLKILLTKEEPLTMEFEWNIHRMPESTATEAVVSGIRNISILSDKEAKNLDVTNPYVSKDDLLHLIQTCDEKHSVKVDNLIPTFIVAKEKGASVSMELFPKNKTGFDETSFKRVALNLHPVTDNCTLWNNVYWSFNQESKLLPFKAFINDPLSSVSKNRVQFYIFSNRIVSSQYQLIASYGIIGLYISVVLVIFKFIRLVLADSSTRIVYQEMPCPDLIMNLVSNMEMVRDQNEFVLEQILYRKLLLLYRSPETLIVWTGRHRHLKQE